MNNKLESSSQYTSFNSIKVLAWREKFEAIMEGEIPTPVAVTIDPTNECNLQCMWCNAKSIREKIGGKRYLTLEEMHGITDFLANEWNLQGGVCVAGGGEPFLNPHTPNLLYMLKYGGLEVGVITNGTELTNRAIEALAATCRWVGFSMDAGSNKTHAKIKKGYPQDFQLICDNIRRLVEARGANEYPEIGYKFLIHKLNVREIYKAAKIAHDLGCNDFHARPVYLKNAEVLKGITRRAWRQVAKARRKLESPSFRVHGVRHKFTADFERRIPFGKCEVASIGGTVFCADGGLYLCCDNRGKDTHKLCDWWPTENIKRSWGSEAHKRMQAAIDVNLCGRCTYVAYGEVLEEVFRKDKMTHRFV